jgi:hypothetical protein
MDVSSHYNVSSWSPSFLVYFFHLYKLHSWKSACHITSTEYTVKEIKDGRKERKKKNERLWDLKIKWS